MHPPQVKQQALALISAGLNDCEVARRTGVARTTIRDWRRPSYVPRGPQRGICPRCWQPAKPMRFSADDYCELLGLYLGDGCISETSRTDRLRITLDDKYPWIIEEARRLLARCFHANAVRVRPGSKGRCSDVSVYSDHLSCLLPQHGPGRKHERDVALERWQAELVTEAPWALLKGLIRSDGCVFRNRTGAYSYLSYDFTNRSSDIAGLFVETCRSLGLSPRANWNAKASVWRVRLNRRDDVRRLVAHVGIKS